MVRARSVVQTTFVESKTGACQVGVKTECKAGSIQSKQRLKCSSLSQDKVQMRENKAELNENDEQHGSCIDAEHTDVEMYCGRHTIG